MTVQMTAIEKTFNLWHTVFMLYSRVLTFELVYEIFNSGQVLAILAFGVVDWLYEMVLTFESVGEILKCDLTVL